MARSWTPKDILSILAAVQSCQVIMRSGAKLEIKAKVMVNDPLHPSEIYFFEDHDKQVLVASFRRDEVAGVIFHPTK